MEKTEFALRSLSVVQSLAYVNVLGQNRYINGKRHRHRHMKQKSKSRFVGGLGISKLRVAQRA